LRAQSHGHPLIRAADGSVTEAEAEVRGASRARWPQLAFVVGADAFDPTLDGTDWRVGVDLQLPLGGKQGAKEQAATASEQAARNRRRAAAARVDASVVASYRALQAASGRLVALDQKIVPAEREAERLARLAYQEGESDLTSVLTAERGLAEVEADLVDARAALATAHADLDLAVGGAR
jgi:outer membrane protein TolC